MGHCHSLHPHPSTAPAAREPGSLCLFSFPGGKCDPADRDVVHTALRETREEVGLVVPEEHVWGVLRPVHDQVSPPGPETTTGPCPIQALCLPWARSRDPRDKEGGHGLWQSRSTVGTPAWQLCSTLTQPVRKGPGVFYPLSRGILRLRSWGGGGSRVNQLCSAPWTKVGEGFAG